MRSSTSRICGTSSKQVQCVFFFFFGIVIGLTFGCMLTLMLTDWKTTYYYYNGNGATVELDIDSTVPKFSSVEFIKASDDDEPTNHLSKRSDEAKEDQIYVKNILTEIDEQSHLHPTDIPNWYDSELITKYNPQASFKYNENFWLHRRDVLVLLFMKTCDEISKLPLLLDTWAGMIDTLVFISSECVIPHEQRRPFVIQLSELGASVFPPQKRTLSILKYAFEKYGRDYSWFMFLADENTYINVRYLQQFVHQLNFDELYYIGNPKRLSIEELQKHELYQHEQFCQSRLGVLFSNKLLQKLIPLMETCTASEYTIQHPPDSAIDEDVELGRCISRKLGRQCWSGSKKQNKLFYFDSEGELSNNLGLIFKSQFYSDVVTIHPIRSDTQMQVIHYYYGTIEYNRTKQLVVSLGKTVNHLCQGLSSRVSSSLKLQTIFKNCNINFKEDLNDVIAEEASIRFAPKGIHEVQSWNYFDGKSIYEGEAVNPRKGLAIHKYHKRELEDVLLEIMRLANLDYPSPLVFNNLINGYVKHNGLRGNEYIIDAEFTEANNPYIFVQRRFSLLKPLSPTFILQPSKNTVNEVVTILIPINHVANRLEDFFAMYEENVLVQDKFTRVALVVFGESDVNYCKSKVKALSSRYPGSKFMIIQGNGEFARAKALHTGMKALEDNSLVFICDVDMTIEQPFLDRCRKNTIKGKQVYYPQIFKWYNTDYVYKFKRRPMKQNIARDTGHWGYYSYGMLCIYRSDYVTTEGFDSRIVGWGGEDIKFYEEVLKTNLKVLRAPDPGITHRWHEKKCFYNDLKRYQDCLSSKAEVLADRRDLARYVFEIEERKNSEQFFCL